MNHAQIINVRTSFSRRKLHRRGFLLVEATMTMAIMTVIGLVMLKLSLNILQPRQWTMTQTLTDAFMSLERAKAERIPFSQLTAPAGSPWPDLATAAPANISVLPVPSAADNIPEIGRLPGAGPAAPGPAVTGILTRTRQLVMNPATVGNTSEMEVWKVQSVLTYTVPGRGQYIKSRSVIRSQ